MHSMIYLFLSIIFSSIDMSLFFIFALSPCTRYYQLLWPFLIPNWRNLYKILEGKIFILPSKPIQEENDYGLSSKSFVFETICRISPLIYSCTFQLHKHTA